VKVADYLAQRMVELGIKDVFGLPGDFNFNVLYALEKNENINWINCTNELNAGYAADGYARLNGFGAVVTTYGVGELSAINAIAGANAERIPLLKIAGVPSSAMIENNVILHHNFEIPDYYAFAKAYSHVVEAIAYLNKDNAKAEIDRVIDVMVKARKPVYIAIPVDICEMEIDSDIPQIIMESDSQNLETAVNKMANIINNSTKPMLLADYIVKRYKVEEKLQNISNKTNIPSTTLLMGKGAIDETSKSFIGTEVGVLNSEAHQQFVKEADLIIAIGTLLADLNSGGFSVKEDSRWRIRIEADYVVVDGERYDNVYINDVLDGLYNALEINNTEFLNDFGYEMQNNEEHLLKVADIFPALENFFEEDDNIFIETGMISPACGAMRLPKGALYSAQTLWGSIGWATPAAFGGAIAERERRTILFTGEGAHQFTIQEVSNFFEHNLRPIIFVLNNSGYTIERMLSNDAMDRFNEIIQWDYSKLPALFGKECFTAQVKTNKDLANVLTQVKEEQKTKLCYVEIFADKFDYSEPATNLIKSIRATLANKTLVK